MQEIAIHYVGVVIVPLMKYEKTARSKNLPQLGQILKSVLNMLQNINRNQSIKLVIRGNKFASDSEHLHRECVESVAAELFQPISTSIAAARHLGHVISSRWLDDGEVSHLQVRPIVQHGLELSPRPGSDLYRRIL